MSFRTLCRLVVIFFLLGIWIKPALAAPSRRAALSSPYDIIAAVNQLRAANGLPAYTVNNALMGAAQAHSDYMASSGNISHTGKGGSSPRSRAMAYGYGGGAAIYVSENIAGGTNMSAYQAIALWQGDSLHMNTMLSGSYTDVGSGVASSGNMTYYTLVAGYVAGQAGNAPPSPAGTVAPPAQTTRWPTPFKLAQVQTVTPQLDGSIVHIVQPGEVLITIAEAYQVKLGDLLKLNNLTDGSVIYPKQKLLIKPPEPTATLTPTPSETPLPPTATRLPTRTPTVTLTSMPTATSTPQPPVLSVRGDPLLLAIVVLVMAGTALVAIGGVLKRGRKETPPG